MKSVYILLINISFFKNKCNLKISFKKSFSKYNCILIVSNNFYKNIK